DARARRGGARTPRSHRLYAGARRAARAGDAHCERGYGGAAPSMGGAGDRRGGDQPEPRSPSRRSPRGGGGRGAPRRPARGRGGSAATGGSQGKRGLVTAALFLPLPYLRGSRLISFGEGRPDTRRQQPRVQLCAAGEDASDFAFVLQTMVGDHLLAVDDDLAS